MDFQAYIPVILAAVTAFIILTTNPKFLQGKQYGDKPKGQPDALMTSLIILLVGAIAVYLLGSGLLEGYALGSRNYRMTTY